MVEYPIKFQSESETEKNSEKWSLKTGEGLETDMSAPEEFGGSDSLPSPEDLFSASIQTCMIATLEKIAERKNLAYSSIETEGEVSLARGEDTRPVMKNAKVDVTLKGVKDKSKARKVASAAEKNCFIHNSIKTDIQTHFKFR
jgi:organic hydroperoxide reductase OsmC/OhrA